MPCPREHSGRSLGRRAPGGPYRVGSADADGLRAGVPACLADRRQPRQQPVAADRYDRAGRHAAADNLRGVAVESRDHPWPRRRRLHAFAAAGQHARHRHGTLATARSFARQRGDGVAQPARARGDRVALCLVWPERNRRHCRGRTEQVANHRGYPARGRPRAESRSRRDGRKLPHVAPAYAAARDPAAARALSLRRFPVRPRADLEDRAGRRAARPQQRRRLSDSDLFPVVRREADPGLHVRLHPGRAGDRMGCPAATGTPDNAMADLILRLHIESKSFNTGRGELPVLGGIDIVLGAREIVALVGPSGCGKTTLLRIVGGLDSDFHGTLDWCGAAMPRIGTVFQEPRLLPWRTVRQNLLLAQPAADAGLADALLETLDLAPFAAA